MYVVTLNQDDLTWLAFAAGIAAGSGNQAAHASLFGILSRIQSIPEDAEVNQTVSEATEPQRFYAEEDAASIGAYPDEADPNFLPPLPSPPVNRQTDFGPGPVGGVLG